MGIRGYLSKESREKRASNRYEAYKAKVERAKKWEEQKREHDKIKIAQMQRQRRISGLTRQTGGTGRIGTVRRGVRSAQGELRYFTGGSRTTKRRTKRRKKTTKKRKRPVRRVEYFY